MQCKKQAEAESSFFECICFLSEKKEETERAQKKGEQQPTHGWALADEKKKKEPRPASREPTGRRSPLAVAFFLVQHTAPPAKRSAKKTP